MKGGSTTRPVAPGRDRVLVVAYFFPPLGGGGVQRTLKFVRYLPESGWDPVVIAPRNPGYEIRDERSVDLLPPGLDIERSFVFEPWWPVLRTIQRVVRSARSRLSTGATAARVGRDQTPSRLVRLASIALFPDEHVAWIPFAVRSALRTHRRQPVSAIYSTSPPITGHVVAGIVARQTGLPWVADFRDPWIGNSFLPPLPGVYRAGQRWIEQWIVHNATRVIAATPSLTTMLRERYPAAAARISTIPNGYDSEEIAAIRPVRRDDGFVRLVYAGSIYGGVLDTFLAGVARFLDEDAAAAERLRVDFFGWLDSESSATARRWLAMPSLANVVSFTEHQPRSNAMAVVGSADAALYLLADDPRKALFVGGKLYEYIGLSVPVLAVAPPGDARQLLESLGWGVIAEPTPEGVAIGLRKLLASLSRGETADPSRKFDRRTLTVALAQSLDEARSSLV